jgi:hypothetical protein
MSLGVEAKCLVSPWLPACLDYTPSHVVIPSHRLSGKSGDQAPAKTRAINREAGALGRTRRSTDSEMSWLQVLAPDLHKPLVSRWYFGVTAAERAIGAYRFGPARDHEYQMLGKGCYRGRCWAMRKEKGHGDRSP